MRFCGEKFSSNMHNYLIYKEKEKGKYVWLRTNRRAPQVVKIFAEFKINGRVVKKAVIPADEIMQAFAYMHLVPTSDFYAMEVWQRRNIKKQPQKPKTQKAK